VAVAPLQTGVFLCGGIDSTTNSTATATSIINSLATAITSIVVAMGENKNKSFSFRKHQGNQGRQ
jgi:hypothetical protein